MSDPCRHDGKQVLLVEGKDDCHVVLALCSHYKIPENFGVYQCENRQGVLTRLNALILAPDGKKAIGVVLDADDSIIFRWQQIIGKVRHHGYRFPETPSPNGTIVKNAGFPDLGIWLMPNNNDVGFLEDFLLEMANPKAIDFAKECVEKAQKGGVASFKEVHTSKAEIHTYLAWQDEPGKPLGQSVTSHALQPDTLIAERFAHWLAEVFDRKQGRGWKRMFGSFERVLS